MISADRMGDDFRSGNTIGPPQILACNWRRIRVAKARPGGLWSA